MLEKRRGDDCFFIPGEGPGWQMRSDAIPDAAGGEGGHGVARPDGVIHRYRIYRKKMKSSEEMRSPER